MESTRAEALLRAALGAPGSDRRESCPELRLVLDVPSLLRVLFGPHAADMLHMAAAVAGQ